MTFQHPNSEPASPPPGWYPDPVTGTGLRWWDGVGWTDQTSLGQASGPGSGMRPAGEWISATFKLFTSRAGHLFPLIVLLSVLPGIVVAITLYFALADLVLVATPSFQADQLESLEVEGLEASRFVPMAVAIVGSIVFSMILATATTLHVAKAAASSPERWEESLRRALRWPRVLGVSVLVGLTLLLVVVLSIAFLVAVGAVAWPALVILVPLSIVALVWVGVRLSLATTAAALAPRGVRSLGHSITLTSKRTWGLFGRFCLIGVVIMGVQLAANLVTAPFVAAATDPAELEGSRIELLDLMGGSLPLFAFQQLVGVLIGGFVTALLSAGLVLLYSDLGGQQSD